MDEGRAVISKRLKQLRLKAGLSQKALGIAAGIDEFSSSTRMNTYEQQKHTPDYMTLARIGKVLGAPVSFFVAKDDDLAELIRIYSALPVKAKRKSLRFIASLSGSTEP